MRIRDLLAPESIQLNGSATGKEDVLNQMVSLMVKSGKIADEETYRKGVFAREEESTTGIGEGIAIPHCKSAAVKKPGLSAMVLKNGVDFDVLSRLSVLLMDENFTNGLKQAASVEEFLKVIDEAESEKEEKEEQKETEIKEPEENQKKILAVTGCPTGIAHTYMAAESLEKKAAELGCFIKVETRGSGGAKNVLTAKEIEEADCIIVAADTKVPMDRFAGKPVIICQVSDGISKADKLIQRAMAKDAPIYKGSGEASESESMGGESFGHKVYKHLMNGVSHMLPFVVGGGIMIAIAFLIDSFGVDLASLPTDERANFGTILPAAAFFKSIGGLAFGFMLPVLAGYIAMSIADRPGLVVGFVGGAIAANGKSGFLGALVAGFAAGLIIQLLKKIFDKLPKGLDGLKPVLLYPLLGVLLIGALMTFIIEPPVGALNIAINTGLAHMNGVSSVLLGALVAGMMAVDMGGPLNKAAYVFGTASIAAGNYNIMAAVMIGGMVPPIAIALGTLFFKNKFTAEERKAGPTNFIMGLSFITEGAIPFAAADPLRVIPACVVGSAIAGAMSMAFNCTLMAPHGGIFVFLVMGNAIWYLLSLIVGSAVSCLLLGLLKKKIV